MRSLTLLSPSVSPGDGFGKKGDSTGPFFIVLFRVTDRYSEYPVCVWFPRDDEYGHMGFLGIHTRQRDGDMHARDGQEKLAALQHPPSLMIHANREVIFLGSERYRVREILVIVIICRYVNSSHAL